MHIPVALSLSKTISLSNNISLRQQLRLRGIIFFARCHQSATKQTSNSVHVRCFSLQEQTVNDSCSSSSTTSSTASTTSARRTRSRASALLNQSHLVYDELAKYQVGVPIEEAYSLPSSWYWNDQIHQLEKEAIFLDSENNSNEKWVAVDVFDPESSPGSYKTGIFAGQPYLLTKNANGTVQAFYNMCTHMGSCLVGPWTTSICKGSLSSEMDESYCSSPRLTSALVGQSSEGCLIRNDIEKSSTRKRTHNNGIFQCPYHGWQFNIDGNLLKAPNVKGIQNFRAKDFNLRSISMKQVGPIVFLNFSETSKQNVVDGCTNNEDNINSTFQLSKQSLLDRLDQNGFNDYQNDFSNLNLIQTKECTVNCNWKVFCDNYGDGCYHCSYAHADLVSNIDESNYTTMVLTPNLSIQQAPPAMVSDKRFGTKTAVFAQWYPNLMINRYGPWLDIDIVVPISATTSRIIKAWFLEKDYNNTNTIPSNYVQSSIQSSLKVHDEDVFLCENIQIGVQSYGFKQGRYVPSKQIAAYHFHQRLANDLHEFVADATALR
jgi:choline monooxygenase